MFQKSLRVTVVVFAVITSFLSYGQELSRFRYVPDGDVYDVVHYGDTLFFCGNFNYFGLPMGCFTMLDKDFGHNNYNFKTSGPQFDQIISDNNGGYYVSGPDATVTKDDFNKDDVFHVNADGTLDTGFVWGNGNGFGPGSTTMALDDTVLYVAGTYWSGAGLHRYNAKTGEKDDTWQCNVDRYIQTIVVDSDYIYVRGSFDLVDSTDFVDFGRIDKETGLFEQNNILVNDVFVSDGAMADGDSVVLIQAQITNYFASLVGFENMNKLNPHNTFNHLFNSGDRVNHIIADPDSNYYVSGNFTVPYTRTNGETIEIKNLIRLNPNYQLDTTFQPFKDYPSTIETCNKMTLAGNNLLITTLNASSSNIRLYTIDLLSESINEAANILADGDIKEAIAIGADSTILYGSFANIGINNIPELVLVINGNIEATALSFGNYNIGKIQQDAHNPNLLYISGSGSFSNGFNGKLLRYDIRENNNDIAFNPIFDSSINDFILKNDSLYCIGNFNTINGTTVSDVAGVDTAQNVFDLNINIDPLALNPTKIEVIKDQIALLTRDYVIGYSKISGEKYGWMFEFEDDQAQTTTVFDQLFVMGGFTQTYPNNDFGNGIYKVRKSAGPLSIVESFRVPVSSYVKGIYSNPDATAFVYGNFYEINDKPDSSIVKISMDDGRTLPWVLDLSISRKNNIRDIHVHNDTVYLAASDSVFAVDYNTGTCFWRFQTKSDYLSSIFVDDKRIILTGRQASLTRTVAAQHIIGYVPSLDSLFTLPIVADKNVFGDPNHLRALKIINDTLYFGGVFQKLNGNTDYTWGRYDLKNKTLLSTPASNIDVSETNEVIDILSDDTHIYFSAGEYGEAYTLHNINRSTGLASSNFITYQNPNSWLSTLQASESVSGIYVYGPFTNINNSSPSYFNLAKIENGVLTDFQLPLIDKSFGSSFISDVKETSDYLYVSGVFKLQGMAGTQYLRRLNLKTMQWDPTFNSSFSNFNTSYEATKFDITGGRMFVAGDFDQTNGTTTGSLSELSLNYGFTEQWAPGSTTGYELVDVKAIKDRMFVLGQNNLEINNTECDGMMTFELDPNFHTYRIDSIIPNKGNNLSFISADIIGLGFIQNSTVILRKGATEIVVNANNNFVEHRFIQTQFDFTQGAELGFYDVVVKTPNGDELVLENGFEIIAYEHPVYYAELIAQSACRKDLWQDYTIVVKNESYQDVLGVPVNIGIEKNGAMNFEGDFFIFDDNNSTQMMQKNLTPIIVDSIGGQKFDGHVYSWIIPILPAHSEKKITYTAKYPVETDTNWVITWTDQALHLTPNEPKSNALDCFDFIANNHATLNNPNCISDGITASLEALGSVLKGEELRLYLSGWGNGNNKGFGESYFDLNHMIDSLSASCSEDLAEVQNIWATGWNGITKPDTLQTVCATPFFPQAFDFKNIPVVASLDPNDKTGPLGVFARGIINNQESIYYRIRFENDSTASAPAQVVTIVDSLDVNVFDPKSVVFEDVKFNQYEFHAEPNAKYIDAKIDLRPQIDLIAHIKANVSEDGVITWTIASLDPTTLLPTQQALAGLLPANKTSPEGQGSVFFKVSLKKPIPDNLVINNKADIIFDNNENIPTNTFTNLIDKIDPVSTVGIMPAQTFETNFYVPIDGFDNESGVLHYDLYASKNAGSFKWVGTTQIDSILFNGEIDNTYNFYTIATDSAGNVENKSAGAEATILIGEVVGIDENNVIDAHNILIYPNPVDNEVNIALSNPEDRIREFTLYKINGQIVRNLSQLNHSGLRLNLGQESNGIFLLQVKTTSGKVWVRKLFKK